MPSYKPPLKDFEFLIKDVLKAEEKTKDIKAYDGMDWEMSSMFLDSIAEYATRIAQPLNKSGDEEGCTFHQKDKSVTTPKGFKEGYDEACMIGVPGFSGSQEHGGLEQPHYLGVAMSEILTSANFSLASYAGLTAGAAKAIEKYGSDEIKSTFLPKMYTGEWSGTMCLTEPNAGSDLSVVGTKAMANDDGTYDITGGKIFITCGEHDLSDNICHLVLARLPGAPEGTRGISLFLVPKKYPDENGNVTEANNNVSCGGIEHKMGINGSATCSINFDASKGVLVGNENEGLKAMFTMMNDARLNVAIQGISMSEAAWQQAAVYSTIRVQGKSLKDSFNKNAKPVEIINHANIRRDLVEMKAQIDGFRALALDAAIALDLAEKHPDEKVRKEASDYSALMTPVLKACATDLSCSVSQRSIQVHGGMGFIRDTGVEQFYRDSLIGTIYEGTNDIQGMDFAFRKALDARNSQKSKGLKNFLNLVKSDVKEIKSNGALKKQASLVGKATNMFDSTVSDLYKSMKITGIKQEIVTKRFKAASKVLGSPEKQQKDMVDHLEGMLIHSRDIMDMFGKIAIGRMWLKMMDTATEKLETAQGEERTFYESKISLGTDYINRVMIPEVTRLKMRIKADTSTMTNMDVKKIVPNS